MHRVAARGEHDHRRGERADVVRALTPQVLTLFERVANRRNGVAMAEAPELKLTCSQAINAPFSSMAPATSITPAGRK